MLRTERPLLKFLLVLLMLLPCSPGDQAAYSDYNELVNTQDITTSRSNTLLDDADDLQPQLDNELNDKLAHFKTTWMWSGPSYFPFVILHSTTPNILIVKIKKRSKNGRSRRRKRLITGDQLLPVNIMYNGESEQPKFKSSTVKWSDAPRRYTTYSNGYNSWNFGEQIRDGLDGSNSGHSYNQIRGKTSSYDSGNQMHSTRAHNLCSCGCNRNLSFSHLYWSNLERDNNSKDVSGDQDSSIPGTQKSYDFGDQHSGGLTTKKISELSDQFTGELSNKKSGKFGDQIDGWPSNKKISGFDDPFIFEFSTKKSGDFGDQLSNRLNKNSSEYIYQISGWPSNNKSGDFSDPLGIKESRKFSDQLSNGLSNKNNVEFGDQIDGWPSTKKSSYLIDPLGFSTEKSGDSGVEIGSWSGKSKSDDFSEHISGWPSNKKSNDLGDPLSSGLAIKQSNDVDGQSSGSLGNKISVKFGDPIRGGFGIQNNRKFLGHQIGGDLISGILSNTKKSSDVTNQISGVISTTKNKVGEQIRGGIGNENSGKFGDPIRDGFGIKNNRKFFGHQISDDQINGILSNTKKNSDVTNQISGVTSTTKNKVGDQIGGGLGNKNSGKFGDQMGGAQLTGGLSSTKKSNVIGNQISDNLGKKKNSGNFGDQIGGAQRSGGLSSHTSSTSSYEMSSTCGNHTYKCTKWSVGYHSKVDVTIIPLPLPRWDFSNQHRWHENFSSCQGTRQSPISLSRTCLRHGTGLPSLSFVHYKVVPKNLTYTNDGNRVYIKGNWDKKKWPLVYGGALCSRKYLFHSISFYWPSEHTLEGWNFPMETQLLHIAAEYGSFEEALSASPYDSHAFLGIVNIFKYENERTIKGVRAVLDYIAKDNSMGDHPLKRLPLAAFCPPFAEYVCYHGSLTIPPCTESVFWIVRRKSLPITRLLISQKERSAAEHISKLRPSQSPIAISLQRCPTWTSLEPLHFRNYWDNKSKATLLNTGQTAYFTFGSEAPRPRLSGGPLIGEYIFEQMHFHWSVDDFTGCEHVLDGHGYAAECHFVHYNSKYESLEAAVGHPDGLAVVGFLLEAVDAPNPRFDRLVEGLEGIQKRDRAVHVTAESISWMERDDLHEGSYVTYKGSLTTPPYTECVTWIIYEKPVQIGAEQLGLLRQLEGPDSVPIDRNVRPTQRHPPGHSVIYVKQVQSKL